MRIFVGCAAYREVKPSTYAASLNLLLAQSTLRGVEIDGYGVAHGYGTCRNLEALAEAAIERKADALLYHDADMVFEPEDVEALAALYGVLRRCFEACDHVLAASYLSSDGTARVGTLDPEGDDHAVYAEGSPWSARSALRVGFGFILIPTPVLAEMVAPIFTETWDGKQMRTPDTMFGERVVAAGHRLWLTAAGGTVRHHVTQIV